MDTPDVLEAAADYIDAHGWWDGRSEDDDGVARCAFLAISAVTYQRGEARLCQNAQDALRQFVGAETLKDGYDWNDAQPDAFAVTNTMRKCAAELR